MKKLSVVIPVYNVEKYLIECIESVCMQSYRNLEIILVNDGSTDGSLKICEDFASKDSRIMVVSQENGGLSAARNTGIKHATGDYITFIDSDDYVDINMFSYMIEQMEKENADISVCNFEKFWGNSTEKKDLLYNDSESLTSIDALGKLYTDEQVIYVTAWGKIYRRDFFDDITYPVGRINEDVFTTYKTYAKAEKIIYLDMPFYKYRQREGSIIHTPFSIKNLDSLDGQREMKDFVLNIEGFSNKFNVLGEYVEKVIYYYFKLDELPNEKVRKKELYNEAKQLIVSNYNTFSFKEKIKFIIFVCSPSIFKILSH